MGGVKDSYNYNEIRFWGDGSIMREWREFVCEKESERKRERGRERERERER